MNRRSAPRVPCGLFLNEIGDQGIVPCRATNISETGIYLRRLAGGVLLEGERVQLELLLPGEPESLWVSGRVVEQIEETLHDAAAIEFVSVTKADRSRLRGYVSHVRRRQLRVAVQGLSRLAETSAAPAETSAH